MKDIKGEFVFMYDVSASTAKVGYHHITIFGWILPRCTEMGVVKEVNEVPVCRESLANLSAVINLDGRGGSRIF